MAKRKPGKYDHLLAKYKKLPPADLKQHERIQHRKITLRTCPRCDGSKVERLTCDCDTPQEDIRYHAGDCSVNTQQVCHLCNGVGEWQLTATRLAELYIIARADCETLERIASVANVELEAITQLLIDSQENKESEWGAFGASDRAMKLTNGDNIRVQPELYGSVKNKAEFRAWCFLNGLRGEMELPEKKTQDIVRARALVADKEPEGLEIFTRAKIIYTPLKTEETSQQPTTDDDSISF